MKFFWGLLLILFSFSCSKECDSTSNVKCIDFSLIPMKNIENSPDLKEYLIRDDSTISSSIKLVPNQGYIYWRANADITIYKGRYGVTMRNYFDTLDWRNYVSWVNKRDFISLEFNINVSGKQKLFDDEIHKKDTSALRGIYLKSTADGDVSDADWKIDIKSENFIEITNIDLKNKFIEGNFNLNFILNRPSTLKNYAENVQFRCGQFKARII